MPRPNKKEIEEARRHQEILDDLTYIKRQTDRTNGRVTKLEEEQLSTWREIEKLLRLVSIHSTHITAHKEEKDRARDELILNQKEQIAKLKDNKENLLERGIWVLVTILLFILGFTGIINFDFIKALV